MSEAVIQRVRMVLTTGEVAMAAQVGLLRQVSAIDHKRTVFFNSDKPCWNIHIEGACAELAVAKLLNTHWSGALGNLDADDAGDYQVRCRPKHHYDLALYPKDSADKPHILVTGVAPNFQIGGWIMGRDGKLQKYWGNPANNSPAFFVPQSDLRPISEIHRQ